MIVTLTPNPSHDRTITLSAPLEMLGTIIECRTADGMCSGIIVETEAYIGHRLKCAGSRSTSGALACERSGASASRPSSCSS